MRRAAQVYSNFTNYAWNNNNGGDAVNAAQAGVGLLNTGTTWAGNPQRAFVRGQYKLIHALPCVGKTDGISTNWRIRVGAHDRDTSVTVACNIRRALKADTRVRNVDFAPQGDQGHAGNCDVQSAFTRTDARRAAGN